VTEDRLRTVTRHCERGRAFVTAPLVGTETALGDGEPGEIERSVLADVALEPADFALPEPFDAAGTRRAVLVRTDPDVDAVDADTLSLSFSLPKGSYATVVLREYLKADPVQLG
jgi:tRNA pseudouridine13 synthase